MVHIKIPENAIYVKWKIRHEIYDFLCCSMLKYVQLKCIYLKTITQRPFELSSKKIKKIIKRSFSKVGTSHDIVNKGSISLFSRIQCSNLIISTSNSTL